ncbi:MAG: MFS transporter [Chloroflexi bacterium]|nr:MFS transporter [Dehalococcoidia bacterium]MCO5200713.1 MFS transporter [Chloroflexota bacterium]MCZ7575797.1 MFS transporter [Dehalococcoidia bacterium]
MNGNGTSPHPRLINLVLAQGISASGDAFLLTAASIAIYRETDSTTAVSLLLGLAALPTVLLGPLAGTFADWYSRRRIMVGVDIASAAACLAVLATVALLPLSVAIFVAVGVVYTLSTFYRPAAQALLPTLSGPQQLGRANSGLRLATSLANILGPAAAGLLVDRGGFELVLAIDAATFLVSALLVLAITNVPNLAPDGARHSAFADALDGLNYARRNRNIRVVIAAIGVTLLVGTIVNAGTLPLVSRALGLPESRYGVLLAIEGAGAMGLAIVLLYLGPRIRLLSTGAGALIAVGGSTMALGTAPNFAAAAAAIAVQGMSVVALQVAFASYLQQQTVDAFRGRVMAVTSMVASLASISGFAVAGPLVDSIGVRQAFTLAGALICVASIPVLSLVWSAARAAQAERTGEA